MKLYRAAETICRETPFLPKTYFSRQTLINLKILTLAKAENYPSILFGNLQSVIYTFLLEKLNAYHKSTGMAVDMIIKRLQSKIYPLLWKQLFTRVIIVK